MMLQKITSPHLCNECGNIQFYVRQAPAAPPLYNLSISVRTFLRETKKPASAFLNSVVYISLNVFHSALFAYRSTF